MTVAPSPPERGYPHPMTEVWRGIAEEFLHLYRTGSRLLAVAGADAERSRAAADDIALALVAAGQQVERAHSAEGDEKRLRTELISPFRSGDSAGGVLVVSGPASLLSRSARGMWHFVVWQFTSDEAPHTAASALVDVSDPAHPIRRFADYCAVPSTYGA